MTVSKSSADTAYEIHYTIDGQRVLEEKVEQDEYPVKQEKYSVFKAVVEEMEKEGGIEQEIHFDAQTIAVKYFLIDVRQGFQCA